jgi:hypothetical protein
MKPKNWRIGFTSLVSSLLRPNFSTRRAASSEVKPSDEVLQIRVTLVMDKKKNFQISKNTIGNVI